MPGQAGSAIVWSQPFKPQYSAVGAFVFQTPDVNMTVVGNVMGSTSDASLGLPADLGTTSTGQNAPPATSQVFADATGNSLAIFSVDPTSVSWSSLWLTGNFDTVNKRVMWNAAPLTASLASSTHALPASLYRATKPSWWPAGTGLAVGGPGPVSNGRPAPRPGAVRGVQLLHRVRRRVLAQLRQLLLQRRQRMLPVTRAA